MDLASVLVEKYQEAMAAEAAGGTLAGAKILLRWILQRVRTIDGDASGDLDALLQAHPKLTTELGLALQDNDAPRVGDGVASVDWFRDYDEYREQVPSDGVFLIVGPTGSGKTQFACKVAEELREQYQHGVVLIDLDECRGEGGVLDVDAARLRVLHDCGIDDVLERPQSVRKAYAELTLARQLILILDGVLSAEEFEALKPACPASLTLATTPHPSTDLSERADKTVTLRGLPAPDARALLDERCGAELVRAEPQAADALLDLCDGMPGAINRVAVVLADRASEPAPIAGLLVEYRRHGIGDTVGAIAYETERALGELSEAERGFYRLLVALPVRDFPRELVQELDRDMAGALDGWADRWLLYRSDGRFEVPSVAAEHARRLMPLSFDEQTRVVTDVVDVYRDLVVSVDTDPARLTRYNKPSGSRTPKMSVERELHVLPSVVRMAYEHGLHEQTCQLVGAYEVLLNKYGGWREYEDIARRAVLSAEKLGDDELRIRARQMHGRALTVLYQFERAEEVLGRAVAEAERLNLTDRDAAQLAASVLEFRARLVENRADWHRYRLEGGTVDYAPAIADMRRAIDLDEQFNDERAQLIHVRMLANLLVKDDRLDEALAELDDRRPLIEAFASSDRRNVGRSHMVYAAAHAAMGTAQEARSRLDEARRLLMGMPNYEAELQQLTAKVLAAEGDRDGAHQVLGELASDAASLGHPRFNEYLSDLSQIQR